MMLMCCCSKSRKDGDLTLDGPENKIKNINRILLEFVNEESKIGLKEVPCIEMIEKVLLASNKGEVPKKEIIQIYKTTDSVNQNCIKNFLIQDFFFIDSTRQRYDFNKIILFNLLYSGGKEVEKANFLFNVVETTSSNSVLNHSQKLNQTLESLTYISCIVVGEIINSVRRFQSESEDSEFQELLSLYSTNANMLKEFANQVASIYLFKDGSNYLMRQDFVKKLEESAFLILKPHEIRKKYTEYVWQNRARALLPSRIIKRPSHNNRDYAEDAKFQSDATESERQSISIKGSQQTSGKNAHKKQSRQLQENNLINQMKQQQRQEKIDKLMPLQSPIGNISNYEVNKSQSDISMAIYRYEDKSARGSNSSPMNNFKISQNLKPQFTSNLKGISNPNWESTERDNIVTPVAESPATSKHEAGYSLDKDMMSKMGSLNIHRPSDRGSSETQATLLSTLNLKKYQNVHAYLKEMFGEQFVNFASQMQSPFDTQRQGHLQKRLTMLKSMSKLQFPEYNSFPYNVREIFEYYKAIIHKEDLLEFSKGKLYRENIINVYLKILEKINIIRQSQFNFQRATMRNSIDFYSQQQQTPQKILYFNTNFSRKLSNEAFIKDCLNQLQNFFKYDQVVIPFFIDEEDDQRALIVSIKTANYQVDLYDRERETDNHDISDTVLHLLDLSSRIQDIEFNEDQIDGGVEGVNVDKEEDMIVAMCYIAECITFNKFVDLDNFDINLERQRVLDVFLTLLEFQ